MPTAALALLLRAHDAQQHRPAQVVPAPTGAGEQVPVFRRREQLRKANSTAARRLAYLLGSEFADVNRRLNAAVGVTGIRHATVDQLAARLAEAARQIDELG